MRYLSEEKDFLPWHAASRALYPLDKLLDRTESYNIFNVRDSLPLFLPLVLPFLLLTLSVCLSFLPFFLLPLTFPYYCQDLNCSPVRYCKWPRDINFLPNYSLFKHSNYQALVHLHLNSDNCCLRHMWLEEGKVIIPHVRCYGKYSISLKRQKLFYCQIFFFEELHGNI